MKKRLVAILLVCAMMLGCFSACGKKEEAVTLTVYTQLANYSGEQIGWFAQVIKEKFNIVLNIVNDGDGVFTTRMESGNLGDIIVFGNDADYQSAYEAGLLLDWEDDNLLVDYGSAIYENMQVALEKNRTISNGNIYGFGHNVATTSENHASFFYYFDVRYDLYAQLGYPKISTLEDYIQVFKDMKAICPVDDNGNPTYAVSIWPDWDGFMVMYVKATAALYGYDEFGYGLYDTKTQTYNDIFAEDSMYLRCLKFYNTLYQNDLVDPNSMTQTWDTFAEKAKAGGAFFSIFNYAGSIPYNTEEHLSAGKAMYPILPEDAQVIVYGLNTNGGNRVWSIGSKTQYPEKCMELINWLATPEGTMTLNYGPEGENWYYDEDGQACLTEQGEACKKDDDTVLASPYSGTFKDGGYKINNTTWDIDADNPDTTGDTYNYLNWRSRLIPSTDGIRLAWEQFTGYTRIDDYIESVGYSVAIGTAYKESKMSTDLNTIKSQLNKTITDYSWRAIYAKTDAEYDAIVAEMEVKAREYGYDQMLAFFQNEAVIRKAAEDFALGK